jgi:hypothetical protein
MSPDEPEIIRRALRGDDEAFESVIRFMGRKICAVAYGILRMSPRKHSSKLTVTAVCCATRKNSPHGFSPLQETVPSTGCAAVAFAPFPLRMLLT